MFAETNRGFIQPVSGDRELAALREQLRERIELFGAEDFFLSLYTSEVHLGKLAYALDRLADLAERNEFEVIVAVIPFLAKSEGYEVVYAMVAQMAGARGLEAIVLEPALSAAGLENLRSRSTDPVHPNERGHALIAKTLAPLVSVKLRTIHEAGSDGLRPDPSRAAVAR
jgi:hypothetical protein